MKTPEQRSSPLKSPLHSDCRASTQMKSLQFRSIAPKAPPVFPPSAVASCQSPATLPEAPAAASPKSILLSAQNYALMQVAGQDGTFSLVAVSQTPSPGPMQKNPKLPIPRYQPVRGKKTQSPNSTKHNKLSQIKSHTVKTDSGVPCPPHAPESASEPVVGETSLPDTTPMYAGSRTAQSVRRSTDLLVGYPTRASTNTVNVQAESPGSAGGAIAVLSPTIFSKAVQIVPSPPRGKIPILPYSKVRSSLLSSSGLSSGLGFSNRAQKSISNKKNKTSESKSTIDQGAGTTHLKKQGRKRKTMDDILTFEARKKISLTFFSRRGTEKPSPGLQSSSEKEQKDLVDISKKYRSIRPKPVFTLETNVPQLVPLAPRPAPENAVQHRSGEAVNVLRSGPVLMQVPEEQPAENTHSDGRFGYLGTRAVHRCSTCRKSFRFKHHMTSHGNPRASGCPVCRGAHVHSGGLQRSEGKPGRSLRCQFCEKAFGYVGVYFGHLREVHRVQLTVEPSIAQHEDVPPTPGCIDSEDQDSESHVDPVELQIRCGRCQAVTPTFTDMKLHLLHVHDQQVQVSLQGGAPEGGREAERELVKHAAHYWRQLNQRRNLVRCGTCDEEFCSFSKLKHHLNSHHRGTWESPREEQDREQHPFLASRFNCVLCSEVYSRKQEVLEHWTECHRCENPSRLWEILEFKSVEAPEQRLE